MEETKLKIEILEPIKSWFIPRENWVVIGVTYVSKYLSGEVELSHEHTEHMWLTPEEAKASEVNKWIKEEIALAVKIRPELFK